MKKNRKHNTSSEPSSDRLTEVSGRSPGGLSSAPNRPAASHRKTNILDDSLRFLSSVRFGIYLLIILVIISFVGAVIPQKPNTTPDKLQQMFAPANLILLDHLGFLDLFHAWWFKALLTLLGLNIVFASLDHFPNAWKYMKSRATWLTEVVIRAQHEHADLRFSLPVEETQKVVETTLKKFIGRPHVTDREGRRVLFAQRHAYSRLAAYGIHLSLLVIFAGGLIGLQFGYRGQLTLNEGEQTSHVVLFDTSRNVVEAASDPKVVERTMPFTLRLEKADVVFNNPKEASLLRRDDIQSPGVVKNWYCTLSVWEKGVKKETRVVAVNQPLSYRGYRFYQSGFDFGEGFKSMTFLVRTKQSNGTFEEKRFVVQKDQPLQIPELGLTATVEKAGVMSEADIPVAVLSIPQKGKATPVQIPVFDETSTRQIREAKGEKEVISKLPDGSDIFLVDAVPVFATTLQVSRDPGVMTVWVGCVLLMLGLMLAFYFSHQRVWAMLIPAEGGAQVVMGGDSNKNRSGFASKFQRLVDFLKQESQRAEERKSR